MLTKVKNWWSSHKPSKRRIIQLYAALLTNANLKGFGSGKIYQGDIKSICAPGLNCYSCPAASAACPLGALQNALANTGTKLPYYVVGILILYGFLFGRWICGFLCPFGLIQDLLHKIRTPKIHKGRVTRVLSYLKYVILAVFVIAIPLAYGLQSTSLPLPAFCKYICPSGTLLGAGGLLSNPGNNNLFSMLGSLFTWKFCLLIGIIVACIFCYRSFCRFLCPLGAIYSLFNKISLVGIDMDQKKCVDCGLCVGKCQMDIHHVGDQECISCGDCIHVCPTGAITRRGPKILLAPNQVGGDLKAKEVTELPKKTKVARIIVAALMAAVLIFALVYYNFIDRDPVQPTVPSESTGESTPGDEPVVGINVGNICPDLEISKLDSAETFQLSQTRGKITVLNFWGTWCTPCVTELLNEFPKISAEYADQVAIVTVHTNYEQATAPVPEEFVAENFADFGYILCQDGPGESCYSLFGDGQTWPYTVILDENGIIVCVISGSTHYDELKQIIDSILAE